MARHAPELVAGMDRNTQAGGSEAREPMFIQTFVTQSSVEGLDVGVLIRLARLDGPQREAIAMCPGEQPRPSRG